MMKKFVSVALTVLTLLTVLLPTIKLAHDAGLFTVFAKGSDSGQSEGSNTKVIPNIPDKVLEQNRLRTTTPINTKVNLFDYWVHESPEYNDWVLQANINWTGHNMGFNVGHPLLVSNGMGNYADDRYRYGLWNTTATSWSLNRTRNRAWLDDIVQNRLGADGMPMLNLDVNSDSNNDGYLTVVDDRRLVKAVYDAWDKDLSLGYFFDPTKNIAGRAAYTNVRNLFSLDGGNYRFSSTTNYAQFIEDSSVPESDGYFNVYNTWAVKNGNHAGGNFAPFNSVYQVLKAKSDGTLADNGLSCTQNQGNYMSESQQAATSLGDNRNNTTINHYLGMSMETSFIQPTNGVINDGVTDGEPMVFKFSGDNDVWVYIDGILVGDLGGIHSESAMIIDFSNGYVYRMPVKADGNYPTIKELEEIFKNNGYGDCQEEVRVTYKNSSGDTHVNIDGVSFSVSRGDAVFSRVSLKQMHEEAGDTTQAWRENSFTYEDQTIHTLKFFYLERGGYDANLTLDFNLVSVPYSLISKVDQDNVPVANAGFELYAAIYDPVTDKTTIDPNYNEGKPICTSVTDENGQLMLIDSKRRIIQFDELAMSGLTSYILKETYTPPGYRAVEETPLYYENGVVFARNYLDTGAYTTAILNVSMDKQIRDLNTGEVLVEDTDNMNGIIFGVQLKMDSKYAGTFSRTDPDMPKKVHPVYGSFSIGWVVMAEGEDYYNEPEDKLALVTAAKCNGVVAQKNSRNIYAITASQLPGGVQSQYWYNFTLGRSMGLNNDELNAFVAENTDYIYGFYYAPGITNINDLTENSEIHRVSDVSFEKEYSTNLHIPNALNRFRVQKTDYHGHNVAGATFAIYQAYSKSDVDGGESDQYMQVAVFGEPYYINTQLFNLTAADKKAIKTGEVTGQLVDVMVPGADGVAIKDKMKTHEQIKADWDQGEGKRKIIPWDWNTTQESEYLRGLELHGTASFPSVFSGYQVGDPNPYNANDTRTHLDMGYYLVYEVDCPNGYILNPTITTVEVTPNNIYANAGTVNDGVRVGMYAGWPQGTMHRFASEDAVDGTLTYITAQLKLATGRPSLSGGMQNVMGDIYEGLTSMDYKFDSERGYYIRMIENGDNTIFMTAARNLYMFTSQGHPMLNITQNVDKDRYIVTLKNDFVSSVGSNIRNGKLIITRIDKDGYQKRTIVNMYDGIACYKIDPADTITGYYFAQRDTDGTYLSLTQIYQEDPASDTPNDFILSIPNITETGDKDITNLFSVSTLIQYADLDLVDITVKVDVHSSKQEDKPFYFRMFSLHKEVTEITLFDPVTREVADFNGHLNVVIGKSCEIRVDPDTGEYPEDSLQNLSVKFDHGIAKIDLDPDQLVRMVRMPENADHPAYGLSPFIKHRITLAGDGADYTGKLYVFASDMVTGDKKRGQLIQFENGIGYYMAKCGTQIDAVSTAIDKSGYGPAGTQYDFDETTHFHYANSDELFDEMPSKTGYIEFDTAGKEIITGGNTNIYEKDGNYYFSVKPVGEYLADNPQFDYFERKGHMGVFALYQDQSITFHNVPCGLSWVVQEFTLGDSGTGEFNSLDNPNIQVLTDKYTVDGTHEWYVVDEIGLRDGDDPDKTWGGYDAGYRAQMTETRSDIHETLIFHNYPRVGALSVTKKVSGNMGDRSKEWEFKVKFEDTTLNGQFGGVKLIDGEGHFVLKHGETIKIEDIPTGTAYEVFEINENFGGEYITTYDGKVGEIDWQEEKFCTVENRFDVLIGTGRILDSVPYLILIVFGLCSLAWIALHSRRRMNR